MAQLIGIREAGRHEKFYREIWEDDKGKQTERVLELEDRQTVARLIEGKYEERRKVGRYYESFYWFGNSKRKLNKAQKELIIALVSKAFTHWSNRDGDWRKTDVSPSYGENINSRSFGILAQVGVITAGKTLNPDYPEVIAAVAERTEQVKASTQRQSRHAAQRTADRAMVQGQLKTIGFDLTGWKLDLTSARQYDLTKYIGATHISAEIRAKDHGVCITGDIIPSSSLLELADSLLELDGLFDKLAQV